MDNVYNNNNNNNDNNDNNNIKLISIEKSINKYPKEWNQAPCDGKFIEDVHKEAIEMGIFKENDKKSLKYCQGIMGFGQYFYPFNSYSQSMITGRYLLLSFLIDDYIDSLEIEENKTDTVILNIENALIDGTITNENSQLEQYTVFFRNKVLEYLNQFDDGENSQILKDSFNVMVNEFVICIWTLIPFTKIYDKNKRFYPSYQLYRCIRTVNIGVIPSSSFIFLLNPGEFNINIWVNPRFRRILNRISDHISIINDALSYGKELENKNCYVNIFYIFKKENPELSFENICDILFKKANDYIDQVISDEKLLLEEIKDPNEKKSVEKILNFLNYLTCGNYNWSLKSIRYLSNNSPFLETNAAFNQIGNYNNIMETIFKQ